MRRGHWASVRRRGGLCLLLGAIGAAPAGAQITDTRSPVFIANAPLAEEALGTVEALLARGGADEAVRLIQRVLDEQGQGLIASDRAGLYMPVRERVHEVLLGNPELLSAYRERQTPRARALLGQGRWREVERSFWLTEPGAEGTLRTAQVMIESARFASGLDELAGLERHPDAGAIAGDASALAALAAGYIDTDEAWAIVSRLAGSGGLASPDRVRLDRPVIRAIEGGSALDWRGSGGMHAPGDASASLDGVVPESLHSAELTELPSAPERVEAPGRRLSNSRPSLPWAMPTIAGGSVLTADGFTIACFDRFTLRQRWRVRGDGRDSEPGTRELRSRLGRMVEDSASVTVVGPDAFASLGLARSDSERAPGRVLRIDVATGRVYWSVELASLDESLRGAEPRGPIVVDGDVVIVAARKNQRTRRLVSLTLVGLDRRTGALRWTQAVGSTGSLPFQQPTHMAEGGVLGDGVVYWTDKMGLIAAVETGTGRARWVRESIAPALYTRGSRMPFATSLPVLTERGLFVLMPDQSMLQLIDPETGGLIHEQPAEPFADAGYIVRVGERIASVGSTRVAFYDLASFGGTRAQVTLSEVLEETGLRGRVMAVGGRLAVPVAEGLSIVDPSRINADGVTPGRLLPLDATGNPALADGQVVIAGESDVYSFLSWSTASRMLGRRIDEGDAGAALALAELALRSGNQDRVLSAIDDAIRLTGRDRALASRVFEVVRALIDPAEGAGTGGALGLALRGRLLERMGSVARTSEQRVAHAMAVGDWLGASGDVGGAARSYQDILLEPTMSKAIWMGGGLSVRAELEASRRLQDLGERFGAGATRFAEELAQLRASALDAGSDPSAWVELARRFPTTRTGVAAWRNGAAGWAAQERWSPAERAARGGFRAIELAQRRGDADGIEAGVYDELAGALVLALRGQSRGEDAPGAIESLEARLGRALSPRLGGRSIALDSGTAARRATLGPKIMRDAVPKLIPGSPVASSVGGDPSLVLMHAPHLGRLTLYKSTDAGIGERWTIENAGSVVPVMVHADDRAIVLVWPTENAIARPARAVALDPASGQPLWEVDLSARISAIRMVFADPGSRDDGFITSPVDGKVPSEQLLVSCDGRTLVVTDRRGRAVAIDAFSGHGLWAGALAMTRVFSLDMAGGVVGVCGARPRDARLAMPTRGRAIVFDEENFAGLRGIAQALDPRTGETIQMLDELDPNTSWVRVAPDGQVIVGAGNGVVALDTTDGRVDWSNGDSVLVDSEEAWIVGEWLVVLGEARALWLVPRREGVRRMTPLESLGRGVDRGWVRVERIGGKTVVYGAGGLGVYDATGALVAADAALDDRAFLVSALGERYAVFVERPALGEDGRTTGDVLVIDRVTGAIADRAELEMPLGARRTPVRIALANGVAIIGFGEVSMVLRLPDAGNADG